MSTSLKYEEPRNVSKAQAEVILVSSDLDRVMETLVAVALNESDWRWVQEWCLKLSERADASVRSIAATCLGHLARIHGELDLDKVMPRLKHLLEDAETAGFAETAIEDVEMFAKR